MRQVPHYLIIGDGRLGRHFQHYFNLLQLDFSSWNRKESIERLNTCIKISSHALILITDAEIENFYQTYLKHSNIIPIHFSGSLVSPNVFGAHPLMTFQYAPLYSESEYRAIPFIIDANALDDDALLPKLPNQKIRLSPILKSKYHALCVLSGNFSCILWQKLFDSFENELGLPKTLAHPYLQRQTNNLLQDNKNILTGPLVRHDHLTIEKNIAALDSDPFQEVYKSFVSCYQKLIGGNS